MNKTFLYFSISAVLPINLPACDEPQLMDSDENEETEDATYARDIHNYLKVSFIDGAIVDNPENWLSY